MAESIIGCSIHVYSEHTSGATSSAKFFLEPGSNAKGEAVPRLEVTDGATSKVRAWASAAYSKANAELIDQKCLNLMASGAFSGFAMTKTAGSTTNVYSFYIKVETTLATYFLFPNSDGVAGSQWTKIGAATHDYEELQKRLSSEEEGGTPGTPSTTTGLTDSTNGHTSSFDVDLLTLSTGAATIPVSSATSSSSASMALTAPVLLVGTTSTFASEESWSEKRPVVSEFAAEKSGLLEKIGIRTGATACTCTSLALGVYADNAGVPGALLGAATFTGVPGKSTIVSVRIAGGVSIVEGTKYWLAALPLGGKLFSPLGAGIATRQVEGTALVTELKSNPGPLESYGAMALSMQGEGTVSAPSGLIPVNPSSSSSTASLSLTASTQVVLSAASSVSSAVAALSAPTSIPAQASSSTSTASASLTAPVLVAVGAATSSSSATTALTARAPIAVAAASSTSSGSATITAVGKGVPIPLAAATSTSSSSLQLRARAVISVAPASSTSTASLMISIISAGGDSQPHAAGGASFQSVFAGGANV